MAWVGAAAAQSGASGGIYSCIDAKGRRITADRPIAECLDRDQRVLGSTGVELRRVGPTLTESERAELENQRRQQQAEQRRMREERAREKALLARYPNQEAHGAALAAALEQAGQATEVAQQRLQELAKRRAALDTEMEFYAGDPAKAPAVLRRQVEDNRSSQEEQQRFIQQQEHEKLRIRKRFNDELVQLRPLWAAQAAQAAQPGAGR